MRMVAASGIVISLARCEARRHVLQATCQPAGMNDAERVLSLLIHDLRTPLGVAHGYLRLIRADRLPSPEERDRALAGTQDALARISRLCQDAGAFLADPEPAAGRVAASGLIERVVAAVRERGIAVHAAGPVEGT